MSERILILDDELDMLLLLKTIISGRTPHEVVTTNNPLELEELMAAHPPALVISDLKMLGRDGLEIIDSRPPPESLDTRGDHHRVRQ